MMSKALGVCLLLIGLQTLYTAATDLNACIEADNGISMPSLVVSNPENGAVIPAHHITEDYDTHQIQVYAYRGIGCDCKDKTCQCCVNINIKWLPRASGCVGVSYIPESSSVKVGVTLNNKDLISKTFSIKNPIPLCVSIPYVPGGKVCARVHDIALSGASLKACVNLEIWLFGSTVYKMEFNCFHLGGSHVAAAPAHHIESETTPMHPRFNHTTVAPQNV